MLELFCRRHESTVVTVVATDRSDGDVHPCRVAPAVLAARQREATGRTWVMLDQVHGTRLIEESSLTPESDVTDRTVHPRGDVVFVERPGPAVAVWAADCAPVVLVGAGGSLIGVHAGWRGLAAGVIDVALDRASSSGIEIVAAVVGPVIHPCCYEFGVDDLVHVADGIGAAPAAIEGRTSSGAAALDVPAAIEHALGRRGIDPDVVGPCTGCDDRWYSHRVRHDRGRHAVVAWVEAS